MTPYDTEEVATLARSDQDAVLARVLQASLGTLQADIDELQRKLAEAPAVSPATMVRVARDLAVVVEQGRQNASRLNEELGALGVQLRQQHLDVSDRILALQSRIGMRFDAVADASAKTQLQVAQLAEQLPHRQHALVVDTVQKELALQLLPMHARTRILAALCGVTTCTSIALLALLLMR